MRGCCLAAIVLLVPCARAEGDIRLRPLGDVACPGGAEIVVFDPTHNTLYVAGGGPCWSAWRVSPEGELTQTAARSYSSAQGWTAPSLAVDPLGRGFAVVVWSPLVWDETPGMLQVVRTWDQAIVWQLPIGYQPDCVAFTPDGSKVIIANECEPRDIDRAGGITIVDLKGVAHCSDIAGLNEVASYSFEAQHLARGVTLQGLRIAPALAATPALDIEPEYLAPTDDGVWVTLQENNALAYFDFASRTWTRIVPLGTIAGPIDTSDVDGPRLNDRLDIDMLPMPDSIEIFRVRGRDFLLLANEGERRDNDNIAFADAAKRGMIDAEVLQRLDALFEHGASAPTAMGGLRISTIDGDSDGDGDIDVPSALGARSISVLDALSGSLVWHSGAEIESMTAARWPDRHNSGDKRSRVSGPEPEGLAIARIGQRTIGLVSLERTDAILLYDLTDPKRPLLMDAVALSPACRNPEGIAIFELGTRWFAIAACEDTSRLSTFEIIFLTK